jgi:hypothetical protein
MDLDSDPDPAIFVTDLQDANKKLIKKFFSLILHLHRFLKIKSQKESHKPVGVKVFSYYFCLMIEGSGSGSIPLTNGSGSGSRRPKNILDPSDPTSDPNPQYWLIV